MPSGASIIGKELSPTSWEARFGMKGQPISKSKVTLHGDSLMWVADVPIPIENRAADFHRHPHVRWTWFRWQMESRHSARCISDAEDHNARH